MANTLTEVLTMLDDTPRQTDLLLIPWAAGFIDGEGCIRIYRNRNERCATGWQYYVSVSASQTAATEPECLVRLQTLFGGRMKVDKPYGNQRAPSWVWKVYSREAARALEALLPFLTVKRAEAEIALEYRRVAAGRGMDVVKEEYRQRLLATRRNRTIMTERPDYPRPGQRKKLSDDQVLEIRQRRAGGDVTIVALAKEYKVSESLVSLVVNNHVRVNVKPSKDCARDGAEFVEEASKEGNGREWLAA